MRYRSVRVNGSTVSKETGRRTPHRENCAASPCEHSRREECATESGIRRYVAFRLESTGEERRRRPRTVLDSLHRVYDSPTHWRIGVTADRSIESDRARGVPSE